MLGPENLRKPNEEPCQAVRRARRRIKQKLSAEVLGQTKAAMARELIGADGRFGLETEGEVIDALVDDSDFIEDIARA